MASIPIEEAVDYTQNWRQFNADNTFGGYTADQIFPNAYTVSMADITDILNDPNVAKVRIYFGYKNRKPAPIPGPSEAFEMKVMLVGVDGEGKDIIYTEGENSGIYDHCLPCPNTCDASSPLS